MNLEEKLDSIISLLETLPQRMCDEIEVRQDVKKALEVEKLKENIEIYKNNIEEIQKLIFSENLEAENGLGTNLDNSRH